MDYQADTNTAHTKGTIASLVEVKTSDQPIVLLKGHLYTEQNYVHV